MRSMGDLSYRGRLQLGYGNCTTQQVNGAMQKIVSQKLIIEGREVYRVIQH